MILEELGSVVERLATSDLTALGEGASVIVLNRYLAQLEAATSVVARAFADSGAYVADGARTASSWLALECHLPQRLCSRQLRLGRAMQQLPIAAPSFLAGEMTASHVEELGRLARGRCAEALRAGGEELLVRQAKKLRFDDFQRSVAYFEQRADPDGADERDEARRARRDVSLVSSLGGMWFGQMTLDPISGEIVRGELDRLEAELFEKDRAEAAARLGRTPLSSELGRTTGQRRADALVAMATRSSGATADGAARPLFSVFVDYETMHGRICELASGRVLSPASLLYWLDESLVERAVFAPANRVEVGARRRLFSGATRRAIELRDRRCANRYCDRPAARCQAEHIVPYCDGGLTTQQNGEMLCPYHNRLAFRQWLALDDEERAKLIARQRRAAKDQPEPVLHEDDSDRAPPE